MFGHISPGPGTDLSGISRLTKQNLLYWNSAEAQMGEEHHLIWAIFFNNWVWDYG